MHSLRDVTCHHRWPDEQVREYLGYSTIHGCARDLVHFLVDPTIWVSRGTHVDNYKAPGKIGFGKREYKCTKRMQRSYINILMKLLFQH